MAERLQQILIGLPDPTTVTMGLNAMSALPIITIAVPTVAETIMVMIMMREIDSVVIMVVLAVISEAMGSAQEHKE